MSISAELSVSMSDAGLKVLFAMYPNTQLLISGAGAKLGRTLSHLTVT